MQTDQSIHCLFDYPHFSLSWWINYNVSLFCLLAVYSLQEFYRQPENKTATQGPGTTVYLRCLIKNKGSGAVQWTKGGFGLGIEKSLPHYERYSVIGQSQVLPSGDKLGNYYLNKESR